MLYVFFALLVLAQAVGLSGLRRPGAEARYSALTAALIALAVGAAGAWYRTLV